MTYTFKDFVCPTTANRKGIAALCVTSTKASKWFFSRIPMGVHARAQMGAYIVLTLTIIYCNIAAPTAAGQ